MPTEISPYALTLEQGLARRAQDGETIESLFFSHQGRLVTKWLQYLQVYDHFFSRFKNKIPVMLEIGVASGGSLEIWRKYFGESATIFGIDIDPVCADRVDPPNVVRIGSQDDEKFLTKVVEEMGAPSIVLDDGSHIAVHQLESFRVLFPLLQPGGIYVIEDVHTAYWDGWGGGIERAGTAIDLAKTLIDDQHSWYHDRPTIFAPREQIGGIHIYDSIIVIEKVRNHSPAHVTTGRLV